MSCERGVELEVEPEEKRSRVGVGQEKQEHDDDAVTSATSRRALVTLSKRVAISKRSTMATAPFEDVTHDSRRLFQVSKPVCTYSLTKNSTVAGLCTPIASRLIHLTPLVVIHIDIAGLTTRHIHAEPRVHGGKAGALVFEDAWMSN